MINNENCMSSLDLRKLKFGSIKEVMAKKYENFNETLESC